MPKCIIDGREIEFTPGKTIIEVAKSADIAIPYFCYHPGLSVVAQCRMCAIEIEKMPKLQTACSTVATEGMVIHTKSQKTLQNQKSVMEFLLINHPLDCPVCDKSGECDLQDYSFQHGDAYSRYTEERRTYLDLDMGPVIQKNMNRCIHCTRCIRFGDEVAGIREMVAIQRGNHTEITTLHGHALETEYAGNYSDICPTGSLTLKDFRFKKRAWYLKKTATVCEGCSRGCNMEIQHEGNTIYRCVPRENLDINRYWLCDEGRFNYHYVHSEHRILQPMLNEKKEWAPTNWDVAIDAVNAISREKKVTVLVGSDLTQEEGTLLQQFLPTYFKNVEVFLFGTPGVFSAEEDAPADALLKRTSKTSNLKGLQALGFLPFKKLSETTEAVWIIRGGRATLPDLKDVPVIGMGVFLEPEMDHFYALLPGLSFAEKDGTVVNFQGTSQRLQRALLPQGQSKSLAEICMLLANHKPAIGVA